MFPARTFLINVYLASFDLTITTACYISTVAMDGPPGIGIIGLHFTMASDQILAFGWLLAIALALLTYFGMYQSRRMGSALSDLSVIGRSSLVGFVILEALSRLIPVLEPSPGFLFRFALINFVCLSLARIVIRLILREARRRGHNLKVLLLVTSDALRDRLTTKIGQQSHFGYRPLPPLIYLAGRENEEERTWLEFRTCLGANRVDDVVLALPTDANGLTARLVNECESRGINVRLVPDLFPIIQYDTQTYDLGGIPLVNVHLYPAEFFGYVVLKRTFDVLASLIILVCSLPVCLLIALLVKVTSPGPVLFAQERMGMNGRRFHMLKFRTMRPAAELNADTHWTHSNDPNVTPLGRWLRRSNLDELPQFWNVLRGDMSIVGPRPERPFFIERFRREIPDYMARHYVKSGITGWAQIHGWRGDTSIKDRLAHDLYYIRNWALALDFKILILTLTKTFFHRNAY
jgi:exopolysaccharide biosynthesis polyprenyl glycosylphosphotransferase